jgi:hypothetical protein
LHRGRRTLVSSASDGTSSIAAMLFEKTGLSTRQYSFVIGFSLALRALFVLEPPGSDQGLFLSEASLVMQGGRLYDSVWEHKPPGIIGLYVLARSFASSYVAIHVLNWLVGLLGATLLIMLARLYAASRAAALFAGLIYLAFFAGPLFGGFWAIAQAETFLDPLLGAALWLLAPGLPLGSSRRRVGAGLAIGVAIAAIKYSALPWCALAFVSIGNAGTSRRARITSVAVFLLSCALPGLCLVAYFAATGRAQAWFDATLLFNAEHQRIGASSFWAAPLSRLFPAPGQLLVVYVFAALGLCARFRMRTSEPTSEHVRARFSELGVLLWLLALAQVLLQRKFWAYHYHVILFPLCALAGLGFDRARALLARWLTPRAALLACGSLALILSVDYGSYFADYVQRHRLIDRLRGTVEPDEFYLSYAWGRNEYNYQVDRMVARQVTQSTGPTEPILIWAFEPVIYELSARQPASRFLYDYPLTQAFSSLHAKYVAQLIDDLAARPPALIITRTADRDNLEPDDSLTQLEQIPPLSEYLLAHYTRSWLLADFVCFRRTH